MFLIIFIFLIIKNEKKNRDSSISFKLKTKN